ncbi:choice-of-anchor I family protein [Tistrella sp. BH-R2-4]|uniref:Choice-of-anchor I family protein n=1 Tax=Tistrella arctica TaxID=3133430 RepID=A0ABU9YIK2_9PROT
MQLQILHASDLEGGVDAIGRAANFAALIDAYEDDYGYSITLSAGDNYLSGPFFNAASDPSFASTGVFNDVYNDLYDLTGDAAYAALAVGGGRVDISIMNVIGFDASALGNHEFDLGTGTIAGLLQPGFGAADGTADDNWVGAQFPYLSANLDFSGDSSLSGLYTGDILNADAFATGPDQSAGSTTTPKIAPATLIDVTDPETGLTETIGVVGATTPILATISSPGGVEVLGSASNDMQALAGVLQPVIDEIIAGGVDKVVLVSHLQQIALEQELVKLLHGVDVVIAGGSDTILANDGDVLNPGDTAVAGYPIVTTNADGDTAVIVSTDGEYSYLGRLVIEFDDQGRVIADSVANPDNGPVATTTDNVAAAWDGDIDAAFAEGTKGDLVDDLVDAVQTVVVEKDGSIFGQTTVYLDGDRADVRTQETNLGNLSADANLATAQSVDETVMVSIKNGGGIRAGIGEVVVDDATGVVSALPPQANPVAGKDEGDVSQLDIENALRFNNTLSMQTVTAEQLKAVMEHAVAASGPGATPGQFAQIGGMTVAFNPDRAAGDRVETLQIVNAAGEVVDTIVAGGEVQGDAARPIRVVTLGFMQEGGDGYPFAEFAAADPDFANVVALDGDNVAAGDADFAAPGSEQDALAEYLLDNHDTDTGGTAFDAAETDADADTRIVDLAVQSDIDSRPVAGDRAITVSGDDTASGSVIAQSVWTTTNTGTTAGASEIVAYDKATNRVFVVGPNGVDILDARTGVVLGGLDTSDFGGANSVSVKNGMVAVAIGAEDKTQPGTVMVFDTDGAEIGRYTVGSLPDMVTFTPDGTRILVANEGEPEDYTQGDPEGSISVIDLATGTVQTAGFTQFNDQADALKADGVRIFGPGSTVAQDIEPEYIAISADGQTAYATLQENNAIAIIDLSGETPVVTEIVPLGYKDHSLAGNEFDASDRDDGINIANHPVFGMYMPDTIASYAGQDGKTYLVIANEGDAREWADYAEEERVKDLTLDPTAFPDAEALQADDDLGRLTVTRELGDTDGDGDYDALYAYGGRSFSILDDQGRMIFDSGAAIEKTIAARYPELWDDSRSDNKGPEPEGVTVGHYGASTLAFIGLERSSATMVFDITDPENVTFLDLIATEGDVSPEGLLYIAAGDAADGIAKLIVANEVSGTTTLYNITAPLAVSSDGDALTFSAGEAPTKGTVEIDEAGRYTYQADAAVLAALNPGELATDGFEVIATDAAGGTDSATVTVEIVGAAEGGAGDDSFKAVEGGDAHMSGAGGDDIIVGVGGDDMISTGSGADIAIGGAGIDTVSLDLDPAMVTITQMNAFDISLYNRLLAAGETAFDADAPAYVITDTETGAQNRVQADVIAFGDRAYTVEDGVLVLSAGNDDATFGARADTVRGGAGDDVIDGGAGNDRIDGGKGTDTLMGGAGDDELYDAAGNDALSGGSGNDTIAAGHAAGENVVMFGGSGADTFGFMAADDAGIDVAAVIADFSTIEGDVLDLSGLRGADGAVLVLDDVIGRATATDGDAVIDLDGLFTTGGEAVAGSLTLAAIGIDDLGAGSFVFSNGSFDDDMAAAAAA